MGYESYQENKELTSRVLGLQFWLREEHFVQGRLIVKCIAEINGVYYDETASYIISKHTAQHKVLQARSFSNSLHMRQRSLPYIDFHDVAMSTPVIFILII